MGPRSASSIGAAVAARGDRSASIAAPAVGLLVILPARPAVAGLLGAGHARRGGDLPAHHAERSRHRRGSRRRHGGPRLPTATSAHGLALALLLARRSGRARASAMGRSAGCCACCARTRRSPPRSGAIRCPTRQLVTRCPGSWPRLAGILYAHIIGYVAPSSFLGHRDVHRLDGGDPRRAGAQHRRRARARRSCSSLSVSTRFVARMERPAVRPGRQPAARRLRPGRWSWCSCCAREGLIPETQGGATMLTVADISVSFGGFPRAARRVARGAAGQHRRPGRAERLGQVHAAQRGRRRPARPTAAPCRLDGAARAARPAGPRGRARHRPHLPGAPPGPPADRVPEHAWWAPRPAGRAALRLFLHPARVSPPRARGGRARRARCCIGSTSRTRPTTMPATSPAGSRSCCRWACC